jgi:6-pyruvoyltetrahydropterin/6-carboxytetrahydropterin synthase
MFSIEIHDQFNASHAVVLPGLGLERPHSHPWQVKVFLTRRTLDALGMVVDFHFAKQLLRNLLAGLEGCDLNTLPALGQPATTERIARYLFDELSARLAHPGVAVQSIALCETEGCWAWYKPA